MPSILWVDTNFLRFAIPMLKLDHTFYFSKNRVITSQSYIASWVKVGTSLANQYFTCLDGLPTKPLNAQSLTPAVATI